MIPFTLQERKKREDNVLHRTGGVCAYKKNWVARFCEARETEKKRKNTKKIPTPLLRKHINALHVPYDPYMKFNY